MKTKTKTKLKPNRVELHPATDEWMKGDRFGDIKARRENGQVLVELDKSQKLIWFDKEQIKKEF